MRTSSLFFSSLLLFGVVAVAQNDALNPTDVGADQVGQEVAVEGRIYTNGKSESGIHFYFGPDMTTAFQAIVVAANVHEFKVDVVKQYNRRNVRVTGEVREQDGKYYILIRDPKQIKVVPRKRGT